MRYLVNISYDGTNFYGFQIQNDVRTVEGELTNVISKILNEDIKIVGCSRTDRGVHANSFYFHFDSSKDLDLEKLKYSINSLINEDIIINNIYKVSEDFHARYSVIDKEYLYIINKNKDIFNRNYELFYDKEIDIDKLKEASKYLIGEKDFRSFTSDTLKDNTVRKINYINIIEKDSKVYIYINANGFLRYMVRNIIGLFLEINEGKKKIEDIQNIIDSKDRTKLGLCAPAKGLYLNKVNYSKTNI